MALRYQGVRFEDGSVAVRRLSDEPGERVTRTFESLEELDDDIGRDDVTWLTGSFVVDCKGRAGGIRPSSMQVEPLTYDPDPCEPEPEVESRLLEVIPMRTVIDDVVREQLGDLRFKLQAHGLSLEDIDSKHREAALARLRSLLEAFDELFVRRTYRRRMSPAERAAQAEADAILSTITHQPAQGARRSSKQRNKCKS